MTPDPKLDAKLAAFLRSQGAPPASHPQLLGRLNDAEKGAIARCVDDAGVVQPAARAIYGAAVEARNARVTARQAEERLAKLLKESGPPASPAPNPADEPQTPVEGGRPGPQTIDQKSKKK